jgi:hypothetical protein
MDCSATCRFYLPKEGHLRVCSSQINTHSWCFARHLESRFSGCNQQLNYVLTNSSRSQPLQRTLRCRVRGTRRLKCPTRAAPAPGCIRRSGWFGLLEPAFRVPGVLPYQMNLAGKCPRQNRGGKSYQSRRHGPPSTWLHVYVVSSGGAKGGCA